MRYDAGMIVVVCIKYVIVVCVILVPLVKADPSSYGLIRLPKSVLMESEFWSIYSGTQTVETNEILSWQIDL